MIHEYDVNNSQVWFTRDITYSQQDWHCPEGPIVQCQYPTYCTTYHT
jgi:hypothetical protein